MRCKSWSERGERRRVLGGRWEFIRMRERDRRGGGIFNGVSMRPGGMHAALQRRCMLCCRCRCCRALACTLPSLLPFGASPAPAPASRSRLGRRSRGGGGARRRLRACNRRFRTRRVRHCARVCSRANGTFAGASKVASKVNRESCEPPARDAEADAVSASLRCGGEHGSQLAPRIAAAQRSRAPSSGRRTTLFHEKTAVQ